jgi:hypothetical protein
VKFGSSLSLTVTGMRMFLRQMVRCATGGCTLGKLIRKARRKAFDSLVVCVAWCLWLERNERVFRSALKNSLGVAHVAWDMIQSRCTAGLVVGAALFGRIGFR